MARKNADLEADARQRAAEVPAYAIQESVEALQSAIPGRDRRSPGWFQAALEGLEPEHLSTVRKPQSQ